MILIVNARGIMKLKNVLKIIVTVSQILIGNAAVLVVIQKTTKKTITIQVGKNLLL